MACCSKTQTEDQKQQVLAWHGSHRIQDLVPESNNPLPAQDSMAYGIEQLTNEGIESLQKSAGLDAQLSFSLNVHREKFEEFSMLYVTVIGTWVGQYLYPEIIKGKSNGSTKKQLKVVRPDQEESSSKSKTSLSKSKPPPTSSEDSPQVAPAKPPVKKVSKKKSKPNQSKASKPSQCPPSPSSKQKPKSKPAPVYHLVVATLGKVPRLVVCSTIDEVAREVKSELHSSVPTDVRMWLLDGVLLPIPKVGEFDVELSVVDREGASLKVFQPPEDSNPDADALDGIIIEADSGNLTSSGDVDNDNDDSEFDDFDDDFNF